MIPVHIVGLALDAKSQPVVILKPVDEETGEGSMLPIWIGGWRRPPSSRASTTSRRSARSRWT